MNDTGLVMLQKIFETLQVDDEWSTKRERSFSWIASRLEQTIEVKAPVQDSGVTLFKIVASATVVENVQSAESEVNKILSDLNRFAFGSAYTFDPRSRKVSVCTISWVHEETLEWRSRLFGLYAIGQISFAECEADYIAGQCDGSVAVRRHPQSGFRSTRDEMLSLLDSLIVPFGYEENRFANDFEFEAVADVSRGSDIVATMGASPHGIALETSFGSYTAISVIAADERHRRMGGGLLVRIQLPTQITDGDAYDIAGSLNRQEMTAGPLTNHGGAWCVDKDVLNVDNVLAYRWFIPNYAYQNGLIMDSAYSSVARMRWADLLLNGQPALESPWKRLAKRFSSLNSGS